ncbi:MAG: DNA cytosine methyltransferase [Phycisphaerales bacterium]
MRATTRQLWAPEKKVRRGSLEFAEFFAGIGLVRMGLEAAGWSVAFANDIDPVKRDMYDAHFGDAEDHFHLGDIHKIAAADMPQVSLATASFPCTDLSIAGGRAGIRAGESSAFWGFVDILRKLDARRPPVILLENVVGFLSSNGGKDFIAAMSALNELGYSVDPFLLDAKWFVPQSRARMFVVATTAAPVPVVGLLPTRTRPSALVRAILDSPQVQWRLSDHPEPPSASAKSLPDILEDLPDFAPEWWSRERAEYLFRQLSPKHLAIANAMMKGKTWNYGTVFRRVRMQPNGKKRSMAELRTDGIAGCLRTPKGGSGRQILFRAGKGRYDVRLLTPRECARLMGADEFQVSGSLNDALFGFGDAVCVPAITWIAENVIPIKAGGASNFRARVAT